MGHQKFDVSVSWILADFNCLLLIILSTGTGNQIMGLGPQGGGMVQPSSIPASSCKFTFNFLQNSN
jgi:hypothetical protein